MTALPYSFPLTNPGAEAGTNTGWTSISTSAPGVVSGGAHTGTWQFDGADASALSWWGQSQTLPTDLQAPADAGTLQVTASGWHNGFSGDTDSGALCIECFGVSSNWLAGRYLSQSDPAAWTLDSVAMRVPPGTRSIRISTRNWRNAGTQLSTFWDDFDLTIDSAADGNVLLYSVDVPSTTGWTQVTGTLQAATDGGFAIDTVLNWAASATGEAYRTVSITDTTVQGNIDAGAMTALMHFRFSNFDTGGDAGRAYLEFYNGSSVIIGTRHYSDASDFNPPVLGTDKTFSVAVPAGTRSVRIGLVGTRASGSNIDADFSRLVVFMTGTPLTSLLAASLADDTGLTATIRVTTPVTWDPAHLGSHAMLSGSNLVLSPTNATGGASIGTKGQSHGRKYFELTISDISDLNQFQNWGVVELDSALDLELPHIDADRYRGTFRYGEFGGGGAFDLGAVTLGFALDFSSGHMVIYINYAGYVGSGVLTTVLNAVSFGHIVFPFAFASGGGTSDNITANFGFSPFTLGLPSGYASWDGAQGDDSATPDAPTTHFIYAKNLDIHSDLLTLSAPSITDGGAVAYSPQYAGKYYFEATWSVLAGLDGFGIQGPQGDVTNFDSGGFTYFNNGDARAYNGAGGNIIADAGFTTAQAVGCAVDLDNWLIWWYNPGSAKWNNSPTANPATATGGIDISGIKGMGVWPVCTIKGGSGDIVTFNFGATSFVHAKPTGFNPWYKNDNALQMEWGDRASIAQSSPVANTTYTSGATASQGANRTIVVDVVAAIASGDAPLGYKMSDSAGLLWNKRQDIYDSNTGFHFIRFWARAAAQLSGWTFSVTTPKNAPGELMATARIFAGADTDPWDAGVPASLWDTTASASTITSSTVNPVSQEILVLSSLVLGGTGFDAVLSSGGIEFESENISTFIKEHTAAKYYPDGTGGHAFVWSMGAHPNTLATSTDVLRADTGGPGTVWLADTFNDEALLNVSGDLSATLTDQAVLSARLGMFADLADDLGLTATIRVANPGDLQATVVDDGGLSATIVESDVALFPQMVMIAC